MGAAAARGWGARRRLGLPARGAVLRPQVICWPLLSLCTMHCVPCLFALQQLPCQVFKCAMYHRSVRAVAAAVEVLEESGLPPLCIAIADEQDAAQPLGRVLAEAVRVRICNKSSANLLELCAALWPVL